MRRLILAVIVIVCAAIVASILVSGVTTRGSEMTVQPLATISSLVSKPIELKYSVSLDQDGVRYVQELRFVSTGSGELLVIAKDNVMTKIFYIRKSEGVYDLCMVVNILSSERPVTIHEQYPELKDAVNYVLSKIPTESVSLYKILTVLQYAGNKTVSHEMVRITFVKSQVNITGVFKVSDVTIPEVVLVRTPDIYVEMKLVDVTNPDLLLIRKVSSMCLS